MATILPKYKHCCHEVFELVVGHLKPQESRKGNGSRVKYLSLTFQKIILSGDHLPT